MPAGGRVVLWIKAFHIIFMVTWYAGLLYLPRLYVYHAQCDDDPGHERFCVMEKKLFFIMSIGAVLTILFGVWLLLAYGFSGGWLHLKLLLVLVLIVYHLYCLRINYIFSSRQNRRSHTFYRWFNEIPAVILIAVVILVVVKPF